ncbi:hypothetical protein SLS54_004341 [Diplodia seriata]
MFMHRDIEPETKAISSGYRWTLVYDVKNFEQPGVPSSSMLSAQMTRLYANFETWKLSHDDLESRYVYVLQKDYGDQLSLGSLLGGDLSLARALRDIGHKLGFDILLAKIEKRRHGHVEVYGYDYDYDSDHFGEVHEMEEILEEEISLLSVFDLSGRFLVRDVDIEKEEVLQRHWEDDDAASESNLEDIGYNPTATHSFRGTVSILVARC